MSAEPVLEIRPADARDAGTVREIVRAAYARWVPVIGREPRPMTADYELAVGEHWVDVLCREGRMLGLIETMLRPDHLWIENIAVCPEHQGQGLGRRLLAHAEHLAIAAGRRELRLLTNAAFAANVALYQRTGYRIDREEPFMGGTTVYMGKTLG